MWVSWGWCARGNGGCYFGEARWTCSSSVICSHFGRATGNPWGSFDSFVRICHYRCWCRYFAHWKRLSGRAGVTRAVEEGAFDSRPPLRQPLQAPAANAIIQSNRRIHWNRACRSASKYFDCYLTSHLRWLGCFHEYFDWSDCSYGSIYGCLNLGCLAPQISGIVPTIVTVIQCAPRERAGPPSFHDSMNQRDPHWITYPNSRHGSRSSQVSTPEELPPEHKPPHHVLLAAPQHRQGAPMIRPRRIDWFLWRI